MDYIIQNNFLRVVISSNGAEIQSVKSQMTNFEYIWQANEQIWNRHAPILFPIVGRLKDDNYTYQGKTYHLRQHGFARDNEFVVEQKNNESINFLLTDTTQTRSVYPFRFELRVNYKLLNNLLEENFTVVNKTAGEMIFGIGGHPGFNVPINQTNKKEDFYFATYPSVARVKIPLRGPYLDWNERFLGPTNSLITLSDCLFENDALIFEMHSPNNKISLKTELSNYHVNVWTRDAPFLGIWSQYPKTGDFVCIEPWWGIADAIGADGKLENKLGMNHLAKGDSFHSGFSMVFSE